MNHRRRPTRRHRLGALLLVALLGVGVLACKPQAGAAPQNWRYNTVYQAHSSATFGVHHTVRYRYNGRRIEVLANTCAADNWYSALRYVGTCTAKNQHGRLEVRWDWVWTKGSPPIARSQTYSCSFDVSKSGKITRVKTGVLTLPCKRFDP